MTVGGVVMGRIVAPYGVHGWLKVLPYTAEKDALLDYRQWSLVDREGKVHAYTLKEGRVHVEHLVVMLDGVAVREAAAALQGMQIHVPRAALPKPAKGEFYFVDLIGLQVINRSGENLGTITAVQEYGAQPVLHVAPPVLESIGEAVKPATTEAKKAIAAKRPAELLIPFVNVYIDGVDLDAGQVRVDWWRD